MAEKNNFEDLLNKKSKPEEEKETSSNVDLKARMQKVINASKRLDNDILTESTPDTKKNELKEKLAKASREYNEEQGIDEEEKEPERVSDNYDTDDLDALVQAKKAKYYASQNDKLKEKLNNVNKELDEMPLEETDSRDLGDKIVADIVNEQKPTLEIKEESIEEDKSVIETENELPILEEEKVKNNTFIKRILDAFVKTIYAFGLIGFISSVLIFVTEELLKLQFISDNILLNDCLTYANNYLIFFIGIGSIALASILLNNNKIKTIALTFFALFATILTLDYIAVYIAFIIIQVLLYTIFRKDSKLDIALIPLFVFIASLSLSVLARDYVGINIMSLFNNFDLDEYRLYIESSLFAIPAFVLFLVLKPWKKK